MISQDKKGGEDICKGEKGGIYRKDELGGLNLNVMNLFYLIL